MKPDISSRADIEFIVKSFYDKLLLDEEMRHFFQDFVDKNSLSHHLKIIADFWEDILFQTNNYKNNPMQKHLDFNNKMPFSKEHFNSWIKHLFITVDDNFSGNISETLKTRAQSIATVMQLKMDLYK